jgi:hypothetical protein
MRLVGTQGVAEPPMLVAFFVVVDAFGAISRVALVDLRVAEFVMEFF